ncbi:MAG: DNA translocase FtsK [Candidatus Krumholzibacteria bacterium]|nr:DNA translocase FtsK [Candidatus Krumholzibacteria bacterium]
MSGQNRKRAKKKTKAWYESSWLSGLLLLTFALYMGLSLTGPVGPWWHVLSGESSPELITSDNPGGPVGSVINVGLHVVFGGMWCWTFPLLLAVLGFGFLSGKQATLRPWLLRAIPLWLVTVTWIGQPGGPASADGAAQLGGLVGFYLAQGFHGLFGLLGGRIILTFFLLVATILVFKPWLHWLPAFMSRVLGVLGWLGAGVRDVVTWPFLAMADLVGGLREKAAHKAEERSAQREEKTAAAALDREPKAPAADAVAEEDLPPRERVVHNLPVPEPQGQPEPVSREADLPKELPEELALPGAAGEFVGDGGAVQTDGHLRPKPKLKPKKKKGPIILPGLELLTPAGPETQQISEVELDAAADTLESTLRSFGVEGEVKDVRPGPVVTTYEYQPGPGIRVNQIVQRSDDLALAMRARAIRMEAPIPGKAAVGIEIPNPTARMVRLREVIEATGTEQREPLSVVLGKDVVGRTVTVDIASLPHLLVAGSTGSGKSVCLNAIICNLIMRNDPSTLRLLLIDPKMLEMNVYNGIPHLLLPVVTDPREALKAMQWLVAQMEHRYRNLAQWSVRNIKQYNDKVKAGLITGKDGEKVTEPMPYFLCVVDELADLMMQLGNDFEGPIARIAQKARAVGIHLILATQRPSVDVLTGVIKANIPCRIAFRVIQRNDSRTVLDMNGAEQLLGHGDMLYLQPGRALPVRVHGSFIDVDECEAVSAHWQQYKDHTDEISLQENPAGGGMVTGEDDMYEAAREVVVMHQSGSTSLLQRRLRIGYTRAGRLMDMLEEAGIVGPFSGSKARDVLIKPEDLPEMNEGQA